MWDCCYFLCVRKKRHKSKRCVEERNETTFWRQLSMFTYDSNRCGLFKVLWVLGLLAVMCHTQGGKNSKGRRRESNVAQEWKEMLSTIWTWSGRGGFCSQKLGSVCYLEVSKGNVLKRVEDGVSGFYYKVKRDWIRMNTQGIWDK